jgi:hypothetical protein
LAASLSSVPSSSSPSICSQLTLMIFLSTNSSK